EVSNDQKKENRQGQEGSHCDRTHKDGGPEPRVVELGVATDRSEAPKSPKASLPPNRIALRVAQSRNVLRVAGPLGLILQVSQDAGVLRCREWPLPLPSPDPATSHAQIVS